MPGKFARGALLYFLMVGMIGTYLRARYVTPLWPDLEFANVVHAHSHVAYFGWASLALMAAMYGLFPRVTGRPLQGVRWMGWQLRLTHVATVGALVSFSLGGYTPISIIFSTFNVLLWYLFMRIYRLNVRRLPKPLPVALRYWHGAVLLLFISSLGTWLISVVTARGGGGTVGHQAGLDIFLTNFTDGWLLLGLLGVAVAWLTPNDGTRVAMRASANPIREGRSAPGQWAAGPLPWILVLTPFTFLAELVMFDLPMGVLLLGLTARFALAVPYVWFLWNARSVYRTAKGGMRQQAGKSGEGRSGALHGFAKAAFLFFAVKAVLHFALGVAAIVPSRHLMIAYLHLDLLGFVSSGLLAALYFVFGSGGVPVARGTGDRPSTSPGISSPSGLAGAWVLAVGTAGMVVTLAIVAVMGGAVDPAARQAVNDLLQAAFLFGVVAFIGVTLSVAGLWRHTNNDIFDG